MRESLVESQLQRVIGCGSPRYILEYVGEIWLVQRSCPVCTVETGIAFDNVWKVIRLASNVGGPHKNVVSELVFYREIPALNFSYAEVVREVFLDEDWQNELGVATWGVV